MDVKKRNPFAYYKDQYTEEEWSAIQHRNEVKQKAHDFFTDLYSWGVAEIVLSSVMDQYSQKNPDRRRFYTFEEAWAGLSFEETSEIIFRAVNGLPCAEKDTGQMAELKAKRGVSA